MRKSIITLFCLTLFALILFTPARAHAETITPSLIQSRIAELKQMEGGFFNTNRTSTTCGSPYDYTHTCINCRLDQVLNSSWVRNKFGHALTTDMVAGTSSMYSTEAFAHYMEWYLYRENDSASVRWATLNSDIEFTFNTIASRAQLGDVICIQKHLGSNRDFWGIIFDFDMYGIWVIGCHHTSVYNNYISEYHIAYSSKVNIDLYRARPASSSSFINIGWPDRSYSVSYNSNGGSGYMSPHTGVGYMSGALTLKSNTYTRPNHQFLGWARYRSDGRWFTTSGEWKTESEINSQGLSLQVYADNSSFANGIDRFWIKDCAVNDPSFTFYAQWKDTRPIFYIGFSSNGGEGTMSQISGRMGTTLTIPANTFTKENGKFKSWMLRRSDGKWFAVNEGFRTIDEINANGWIRGSWGDQASITLSPDWIADYSGSYSFYLYAQWNESDVIRLYGNTRYDTAIAIADRWKHIKNVSQFPAIVLASGESAPDALSGGYLAYMKGCPLLITSPAQASKMNTYIKNNLAAGATVYVLGGTQAMPAGTYSALSSAGYKIKRLSGSTRYDTNLAILKEMNYTTGTFLVCTGENYADALAASAVRYPILLVGSSLTAAQKTYLQNRKSFGALTFNIIGGTGAVSTSVFNQLKTYGSVMRISGDTRYKTAIAVAQKFFSSTYRAIVTVGNNFPDSLCAGPLAQTMLCPILLVKGELDKPTQYADAAAFLQGRNTTHGYVLGSKRLITETAKNNLFKGN